MTILVSCKAEVSNAAGPTLRQVENQVIELGKLAYPCPISFPLRVICQMLEETSHSRLLEALNGNASDGVTAETLERWVLNVLREIGVFFCNIFEVYDELFVRSGVAFHYDNI